MSDEATDNTIAALKALGRAMVRAALGLCAILWDACNPPLGRFGKWVPWWLRHCRDNPFR
jgi:hypothetical protein